MVNAAGQVVGQLSGACGFNVGDVCDEISNATVDEGLPAGWPCDSGSECASGKCTGKPGAKICR